jgi:hypothetical protein
LSVHESKQNHLGENFDKNYLEIALGIKFPLAKDKNTFPVTFAHNL